MTNKTKSIFENYLKETELLQEARLGSESTSKITETDNQVLKSNIKNQVSFNNRIVIIAIILLCAIFMTGLFFVFYYRDDPTTIGVIFGGTFLSLLAIVARLRTLWLEKSLLDVSVNLIKGLPPEEAAKYIQTIYFSMLKSKEK